MAYVRSGEFLTGKNQLGDLGFKLTWYVQSQDWYDEESGEEDCYYISWTLFSTDDSNFVRGLFAEEGYYGIGRLRVLMNGLTIYDSNTNPAITWKNGNEIATHRILEYPQYSVPSSGDCPLIFRVIFDYAQDGASIDATSETFELPPYFRRANFHTEATWLNFTDEKPLTIKYTNPAGERVDLLQARIIMENGDDDYIVVAEYRDIPKSTTATNKIINYTFDLQGYELQKIWDTIPTSKSRTVYVNIRTEEDIMNSYDTNYHRYGDTVSQSATFTLVDAPPAFPYAEAVDILEKTVALTGGTGMIKKYNKMRYKIDALPRKGATIKSQSMVVQSKTYTANEGTIDNLESNVFTFYATDSRGLTGTYTITVPMIDYFKPTINQELKMSLDEAGGDNAVIDLTITGTAFGGSFGSVRNAITVETKHKINDGEFGDWVRLNVENPTNGEYEGAIRISGEDISYDNSYTFVCRITDLLETASTSEYTITLKPVFDWGKEDFNFNVPVGMNNETVLRHTGSATNNLVISTSGGHIYIRPHGTSNTTAEIRITPQGGIVLTGDIVINGVSLKSKLGIS
jgi:hypothetical protein